MATTLDAFRDATREIQTFMAQALDADTHATPAMFDATLSIGQIVMARGASAITDRTLSAAERRELLVETRRVLGELVTFAEMVGPRVDQDPAPMVAGLTRSLERLAKVDELMQG